MAYAATYNVDANAVGGHEQDVYSSAYLHRAEGYPLRHRQLVPHLHLLPPQRRRQLLHRQERLQQPLLLLLLPDLRRRQGLNRRRELVPRPRRGLDSALRSD